MAGWVVHRGRGGQGDTPSATLNKRVSSCIMGLVLNLIRGSGDGMGMRKGLFWLDLEISGHFSVASPPLKPLDVIRDKWCPLPRIAFFRLVAPLQIWGGGKGARDFTVTRAVGVSNFTGGNSANHWGFGNDLLCEGTRRISS